MSTCPSSVIITPNNNPVDRMEVQASLRQETVHIQIPRNPYGHAYWIVRFKKRKNNPPSIRGHALVKKVTADEILSPVKRLEEIPDIWNDINESIHEGLKDAVEVGPRNVWRSAHSFDPIDLEIP